MAKSGPQKYPGATRGSHWYQDSYGGSAMESNVGVIHTTEGTSVPSYGGGGSAPNFTALPDIGAKRLRWYQHFDFDVSSRALVNRSGGVQTNTLNAVQIELVGTCDPSHRTSWGGRRAGRDYLFWPDAPDWALAELAKFVRWAHDEHGVKLRSTVDWTPYPASYGATSVRLSGSEWSGYYGWLGHQHVPENAHGDPGDIDFARVLEHARGNAGEDDDMPSAKEIADAVWNTDHVLAVPGEWGAPGNKYWEAGSLMRDMGKRARRIEAKVEAGNAAIVEMAKALAARDEAVDVDALVARIEAAIASITVELNVPEGN